MVSKYYSPLKGQKILRKMLNLGLEQDGLRKTVIKIAAMVLKTNRVLSQGPGTDQRVANRKPS